MAGHRRVENRFDKNRVLGGRFRPVFDGFCFASKNIHGLDFEGGGVTLGCVESPPLNKIKVSKVCCGLNKWLLQTAQNRGKMGSLGK